MKNALLILLFLPLLGFSASVGNPSYPSTIEEGFFIPDSKPVSFRLGYQVCDSQDLVMKFEDEFCEKDFHLKKVKAFLNSGVLTFNLKERLDMYLEMGSYRIQPEFRYLHDFYIIKSDNDFLYRAGTKLILFELLDFTLGADVKYSYFKANSLFVTKNDKLISESVNFLMKEWQIGFGLSQKITILRPYIGLAYRDSRINMNHFLLEKLRLVYKKKAGLFMGSSISLGSFVMLNVELRLINERSTIFSGEVRF